jgi:gp32 DNA binding protein like
MSVTSLSELRKSRGGLDSLMKEVEKIGTTKSYDDDRFWQPVVDKAGNGSATIRFLPPTKGEDLPWVRLWTHGFKGPTGKWYIENSLTTISLPDPVSELNSELWNTGLESNKKIASAQKRKLNYISNVLVISDPANPQNEGKVFLYKYGKKIFDKIKELTHPEDGAAYESINPFDFWAGSNFRLKIAQVEGFRNYDKSTFEVKLVDGEPVPTTSAIADGDDTIEAIWNKQYMLSEFVAPSNFKTYDELKKKLDMVLGTTTSTRTAEKRAEIAEKMEEEPVEAAPAPKSTPAKTAKSAVVEADDEAEEDAVGYFAGLANDD